MSKACLPHMKLTGPTEGAAIINITATLQDRATPFQAHAASAKAGIDVMTNTLGVEWAEYGIRTIGLAPMALRHCLHRRVVLLQRPHERFDAAL